MAGRSFQAEHPFVAARFAKALNFVVELGKQLREAGEPINGDMPLMDALSLSNFYTDLTPDEMHVARWLTWYEMVIKRGVDPYMASTAVSTASFGFLHPSDASAHAPCLLRATDADALARCLTRRVQAHLRVGVRVTRLSAQPGGVVVDTSSGGTLHAERVVVTVPASVLAAEKALFAPPLPLRKVQVLQMLRPADILHGHIASPSALPSVLTDVVRAYSSNAAESVSVDKWVFRHSVWADCGALYFSSSGKLAKPLEGLAVADARGQIELVLARMLGKPAAARLLGSAAWGTLALSSWSSSPLSRGATVMPLVGLSPSSIARLRAPEWNGTLFFAGDAMDLAGFGTAAASLSSARTATYRLLQAAADSELLGGSAASDALQSCGLTCTKCAQ